MLEIFIAFTVRHVITSDIITHFIILFLVLDSDT